jgi:hypothetical protein
VGRQLLVETKGIAAEAEEGAYCHEFREPPFRSSEPLRVRDGTKEREAFGVDQLGESRIGCKIERVLRYSC